MDKRRKRVVIVLIFVLIFWFVVPFFSYRSTKFTVYRPLTASFFDFANNEDIQYIHFGTGWGAGFTYDMGTPEYEEFVEVLDHSHYLLVIPVIPIGKGGGWGRGFQPNNGVYTYPEREFQWFRFGKSWIEVGNAIYIYPGRPFAKWIDLLDEAPTE